jgi:hypothetical protein
MTRASARYRSAPVIFPNVVGVCALAEQCSAACRVLAVRASRFVVRGRRVPALSESGRSRRRGSRRRRLGALRPGSCPLVLLLF